MLTQNYDLKRKKARKKHRGRERHLHAQTRTRNQSSCVLNITRWWQNIHYVSIIVCVFEFYVWCEWWRWANEWTNETVNDWFYCMLELHFARFSSIDFNWSRNRLTRQSHQFNSMAERESIMHGMCVINTIEWEPWKAFYQLIAGCTNFVFKLFLFIHQNL